MESENFYSKNLISIVITTFGRPNYIRKAIENVLKQTFTNIEIIVVDDNGLGTKAQVETFDALFDLISEKLNYIVNRTNVGSNSARNIGAKIAKGEFIAFFDEDDEWDCRKLELQYNKIDLNTGLVYCYQKAINERTRDVLFETNFSFGEGFCPGAFTDISKGSIAVPNPLINKYAFDCVGGFDEKMESCQDIDLFTRIAMIYPIRMVPETLHFAIIHKGKRISSNHYKKLNGYMRFLRKHNENISTRGKSYFYDRILFHSFWVNEKQLSDEYYFKRIAIGKLSLKYRIFHYGVNIRFFAFLIRLYFDLLSKIK